MTMANASQQQERLKEWFQEAVLPLWARTGYDVNNGGFFEALEFNGDPVRDVLRRVRVQGRQIYVFSRAAALGWHPNAEKLAAKGFDYFLKNACPEDGRRGCVHLLTPEGGVADDTRDLYDQAFLLLACAWRWRAASDPRALALAKATHRFLNRELASNHGGWIENDRNDLPRRQNPHMHLFEAFMAMYDATGEEEYLSEADKIFILFKTRFFDQENSVLREFFSSDLAAPSREKGLIVEPGHMVEWVWLLNEYARRRDVDVSVYCKELFTSAKNIGKAPQSVFLFDQITLGEQPGGKRRLWPQTEYIKAARVMANWGDTFAAGLVEDLISESFNTYLDHPINGLWYDQFNEDGEVCTDNVPASILYHLLEATLAAGQEELRQL